MSDDSDTDYQSPVKKKAVPFTGFKTPDAYKENRVSREFDFSISDGNLERDMWLIKAPSNFDFGSMQDVEISLKRSSSHQVSKKVFSFKPIKEDEHLKKFTVLLPEKLNRTLEPAEETFVGEIIISEDYGLPDTNNVESTKTKIEIPCGIKERFVPFGSFVEEKKKEQRHKVKKPKKRPQDPGTTEDIFASVNWWPEREVNSFTGKSQTETFANVSIADASTNEHHKKKKKKKSDHNDKKEKHKKKKHQESEDKKSKKRKKSE